MTDLPRSCGGTDTPSSALKGLAPSANTPRLPRTCQGVCNGVIAATASRPSRPPQLLLARAPAAASAASALSEAAAWRPGAAREVSEEGLAEELPDAAAALAGVDATALDVTPSTGDKALRFQAVVQVGLEGQRRGPKLCLFVVVKGRRPAPVRALRLPTLAGDAHPPTHPPARAPAGPQGAQRPRAGDRLSPRRAAHRHRHQLLHALLVLYLSGLRSRRGQLPVGAPV